MREGTDERHGRLLRHAGRLEGGHRGRDPQGLPQARAPVPPGQDDQRCNPHGEQNQGDKEAEKKFREIANAYEVLRDPKKRKAYDTRGQRGVEDMGFHGFGSAEDIFSAFGDIFGDFFGQRFHSQQARGGIVHVAVFGRQLDKLGEQIRLAVHLQVDGDD